MKKLLISLTLASMGCAHTETQVSPHYEGKVIGRKISTLNYAGSQVYTAKSRFVPEETPNWDQTIFKHVYSDNIAPTGVKIIDRTFKPPINSRQRETRLDWDMDGKYDTSVLCNEVYRSNGELATQEVKAFTTFYGRPEASLTVWYDELGRESKRTSGKYLEKILKSEDVVGDFCGKLNPDAYDNFGVRIK